MWLFRNIAPATSNIFLIIRFGRVSLSMKKRKMKKKTLDQMRNRGRSNGNGNTVTVSRRNGLMKKTWN